MRKHVESTSPFCSLQQLQESFNPNESCFGYTHEVSVADSASLCNIFAQKRGWLRHDTVINLAIAALIEASVLQTVYVEN